MIFKRKLHSLQKKRQEKKLLESININLPENINWKNGAIEYLTTIMNDTGGHNRLYELIKPFQGGPDYTDFYTDISNFVNIMQKLALPSKSRILDVGCGAGWVTHFMAKLGHSVIGIDISDELLDIARERIAADKYPPYENMTFKTEFHNVDIEKEAFTTEEEFDCVMFMSTLHHFLNPIEAIKNSAVNLKKSGLIAIIEASAPEHNSVYDLHNREIMQKYKTLERPYTRNQMNKILTICGFEYFRFYQPVNGFFLPSVSTIRNVTNQILNNNWNIIVASRTMDRLPDAEIENTFDYNNGKITFLSGFHDSEKEPEQEAYRWAGPEALLSTSNIKSITIQVSAVFIDPEKQRMKLFINRNGTVVKSLLLTRDKPEIKITFTNLDDYERFELTSDYVFRPDWFSLPDTRLLSYKFRLLPAE